ncbi:unnamed protein product [Echinostoma caproni]|uniref:Fibronectin type-III domain-containing protein n=1 Tax=Echinostoma caproni TaxID=27848 RepID=A0A183AQQ1_9TREM|nr:unnamed protein product [Echinostoma caproni]
MDYQIYGDPGCGTMKMSLVPSATTQVRPAGSVDRELDFAKLEVSPKDEHIEIGWKIPRKTVSDYTYVVNQIEEGSGGSKKVKKVITTGGKIENPEGKVNQPIDECGQYEVWLMEKEELKDQKTVEIVQTISLEAELNSDKIQIGWNIPREDFLLYNYTIMKVTDTSIRDGSSFMETNPVGQPKMKYVEKTVPECGQYQISLTKHIDTVALMSAKGSKGDIKVTELPTPIIITVPCTGATPAAVISSEKRIEG